MCPLTTWVTWTVFDVTSAPGMSTGAALEMIRVSPPTPSNVPRVTMNDEMPTTAVRKPLSRPTTPAQTRDATRQTTSDIPSSWNS